VNNTVLITGASGVVGRDVAARLSGQRVIGMVHATYDRPDIPEIIVGDIRDPHLGLEPKEYAELVDRVDVVVHSAAMTNWGQPVELYEQINVAGTAHMIEFARAADCPIIFVSSSFVYAEQLGRLDGVSPTNVIAPYVRSKQKAEDLITASGVPYTIFRPTNLIGDSITGATYKPQIVQTMCRFVSRGKAPFFPAFAGSVLDVIPADTVAEVIAREVEIGRYHGERYWLTYGRDALPIDVVGDIMHAHAVKIGVELGPVPIVDPREPLPIALDKLPGLQRAFISVLIDACEVMGTWDGIFPSSKTEMHSTFGIKQLPDLADCFAKGLEYWEQD
jgi:nucleoside-diphosphate-sugar epimerase